MRNMMISLTMIDDVDNVNVSTPARGTAREFVSVHLRGKRQESVDLRLDVATAEALVVALGSAIRGERDGAWQAVVDYI